MCLSSYRSKVIQTMHCFLPTAQSWPYSIFLSVFFIFPYLTNYQYVVQNKQHWCFQSSLLNRENTHREDTEQAGQLNTLNINDKKRYCLNLGWHQYEQINYKDCTESKQTNRKSIGVKLNKDRLVNSVRNSISLFLYSSLQSWVFKLDESSYTSLKRTLNSFP